MNEIIGSLSYVRIQQNMVIVALESNHYLISHKTQKNQKTLWSSKKRQQKFLITSI